MISPDQLVGAVAVETDDHAGLAHLTINRPRAHQGHPIDRFIGKNDVLEMACRLALVDCVVMRYKDERIDDNERIAFFIAIGPWEACNKGLLPVLRRRTEERRVGKEFVSKSE